MPPVRFACSARDSACYRYWQTVHCNGLETLVASYCVGSVALLAHESKTLPAPQALCLLACKHNVSFLQLKTWHMRPIIRVGEKLSPGMDGAEISQVCLERRTRDCHVRGTPPRMERALTSRTCPFEVEVRPSHSEHSHMLFTRGTWIGETETCQSYPDKGTMTANRFSSALLGLRNALQQLHPCNSPGETKLRGLVE